jgi:ring-1,2-phenylacetyl-CoA epoxidase subunit PaaC
MFEDDEIEQKLNAEGIAPLNASLKEEWMDRISSTIEQATLEMPEDVWMQSGGRHGRHGEHLGFILSDMQFLQRAYPGNEW